MPKTHQIKDLLYRAQEKHLAHISKDHAINNITLKIIFDEMICPGLLIKKQTSDQSNLIMDMCNRRDQSELAKGNSCEHSILTIEGLISNIPLYYDQLLHPNMKLNINDNSKDQIKKKKCDYEKCSQNGSNLENNPHLVKGQNAKLNKYDKIQKKTPYRILKTIGKDKSDIEGPENADNHDDQGQYKAIQRSNIMTIEGQINIRNNTSVQGTTNNSVDRISDNYTQNTEDYKTNIKNIPSIGTITNSSNQNTLSTMDEVGSKHEPKVKTENAVYESKNRSKAHSSIIPELTNEIVLEEQTLIDDWDDSSDRNNSSLTFMPDNSTLTNMPTKDVCFSIKDDFSCLDN